MNEERYIFKGSVKAPKNHMKWLAKEHHVKDIWYNGPLTMWVACDSELHVAVFYTSGFGYDPLNLSPSSYRSAYSSLGNFEFDLLRMPEVSEARMLRTHLFPPRHPNLYRDLAERGFFVYEIGFLPGECGLDQVYSAVAAPTNPIKHSALKASHYTQVQ